jgi:DNA-binding MarR family transcriptional regulator
MLGRMEEQQAAEGTYGATVAEAIGELVRRESRARMYGRLTRGLGPEVDETTYPVLSGLARGGPRSAARLAADIGLDRSVVSRHADRLQRAGLLRREADPEDGRATLLILTEDGASVVGEMRARLAARIDDYLAGWPPQEARAFAAALRRFTAEALS